MKQTGMVGVAVVALTVVWSANAQSAQKPLPPAHTTEALLGEMVQRAAVVIAGEVYAVQTPKSGNGLVDVDIRIDQGVRGGYIGMSYVLKQTMEEWQRQGRDLLKPDERYVLLLNPPDAAGATTPMGGALGVLPVDANYNVDLSRLHAAVKETQNTSGTEQPQPAATHPSATPADGSELLASGQMPELEQPTVAFLALLRDLYVLAGGQSAPTPAPASNHPAPASMP